MGRLLPSKTRLFCVVVYSILQNSKVQYQFDLLSKSCLFLYKQHLIGRSFKIIENPIFNRLRQ